MKDTALIIGANGQIGTALFAELSTIFGADSVVACDIRGTETQNGIFEQLDATDFPALVQVIKKYKVTHIYHLAAILSAKGESDPVWAWNINIQTLLNVLEAARGNNVRKVFIPSSIAVFGKSAPVWNTPQSSYLDPVTVYGVSKVATENWCNYYFNKYKLDVRSLRYPGVISYETMPGGGTTDYAIEMYHKAVQGREYTCFLDQESRLPMIYMADAIRATVELMGTTEENVKIRTSYNIAGLSFTPAELQNSIRAYFPEFSCVFKPDFRQDIAASWPKVIDDSVAADHWGWKPQYNLSQMSEVMIRNLQVNYRKTAL